MKKNIIRLYEPINPKLTIYDIKERIKKEYPYFFDRKTMRFFAQTMKSFKVQKINADLYYFYAPAYRYCEHTGKKKQTHITERWFIPSTNQLLATNPETGGV